MNRHQGWCRPLAMTGMLFVSLLLLSGCDNLAVWSKFPVDIYSDATVTSSASVEADFIAGMQYWEERAGHKLFEYRGQWTGGVPYDGSAVQMSRIRANVLMFQGPWPFIASYAGVTTLIKTGNEINGVVIMMNPNQSFCRGDCNGAGGNMLSERKVFTHELGHFLGLPHSDDPGNIMYPTVQAQIPLAQTKVDGELFKALVND